MKGNVFYLITMVVSGSFFMFLFTRTGWNKLVWDTINKKLKKSWNVFAYIIGAVLFQMIIQLILEAFAISNESMKIFLGISMGLALAFIPDLNENR